MQSPFPGMDPYIEACGLWEGFHNRLIHKIDDAIETALEGTKGQKNQAAYRLHSAFRHEPTVFNAWMQRADLTKIDLDTLQIIINHPHKKSDKMSPWVALMMGCQNEVNARGEQTEA